MLTPFEQGIWQSAYAACYLSSLLSMEQLVPLDKALETVTAETPWMIANAAVNRYREWRDSEEDGLDPFHETQPEPPREGNDR